MLLLTFCPSQFLGCFPKKVRQQAIIALTYSRYYVRIAIAMARQGLCDTHILRRAKEIIRQTLSNPKTVGKRRTALQQVSYTANLYMSSPVVKYNISYV